MEAEHHLARTVSLEVPEPTVWRVDLVVASPLGAPEVPEHAPEPRCLCRRDEILAEHVRPVEGAGPVVGLVVVASEDPDAVDLGQLGLREPVTGDRVAECCTRLALTELLHVVGPQLDPCVDALTHISTSVSVRVSDLPSRPRITPPIPRLLGPEISFLFPFPFVSVIVHRLVIPGAGQDAKHTRG